ncbi:MAG TPA: nucleotidyltransferase [Actinomycetota bacterium]|nr:nucleotidyltransferase [Actinomycetota bacterium]
MSDQAETLVPNTPTPFDKADVSDEEFLRLFAAAVDLLEDSGIDYVLMGGLASSCMGRPRWTHDIDFLVKPDDADRTLELFEAAGYQTQKTNPMWLYKAIKDRVVIDIIFKSRGDLYMDDEMIERAQRRDILGVEAQVVPPEDLIVIKAAVHDEERPRHWHDAIGLLIREDLDWEYLVRRARHATRRVLALLLYATSNDIAIPERVIRELFAVAYPQEAT